MVEKSPPSARIRSELLDLVRDLAISEGWTDVTLMQAGRQLGLTPGEVKLAAPEGINTLLETWGHEADAKARAVMEQADLSEMKVRGKVTFGVRARIEALSPYKENCSKSGACSRRALAGDARRQDYLGRRRHDLGCVRRHVY